MQPTVGRPQKSEACPDWGATKIAFSILAFTGDPSSTLELYTSVANSRGWTLRLSRSGHSNFHGSTAVWLRYTVAHEKNVGP